jgi:Uma2 family endonuclease
MPPTETGSRIYTVEDYWNFPSDGKRRQILDGELFVASSPLTRHQRVIVRVFEALRRWDQANPGGEVFLSPLAVTLGPRTVLEPDLFYVAPESMHKVVERGIEGAPELVVEVLSPSTRRFDEVKKRRRYARARVCEYWVMDPESDAVRVNRRDGDHFQSLPELRGDDVLRTPLLPGFEAVVAHFFPPTDEVDD